MIIDIPIIEGTSLTQPYEIPAEIQKLEDGQEIPEGCHVFRIINHNGDDRLTWMKESLESIQDAKRAFVELVHLGLKPFKVGTDGKATASVMTVFDPEAEEVIFMPHKLVRGG